MNKMEVSVKMDEEDFFFLLKRFDLKDEYDYMLSKSEELGISEERYAIELKKKFVDDGFMKALDRFFGDGVTFKLTLNYDELGEQNERIDNVI